MKNAVGIGAVVGYVPQGRVSLMDKLKTFDINRRFLEEKTGCLQLARKAADEDTSDLAEAAARILEDKHPGVLEQLGLLVVVTQNPDGFGLPHVSAILHGRLSLRDDVAAFDISLGCSGWVYALSVAKSFMEANDIEYGLVVTADPYSKVIDSNDRNTALLFGDAATATLLSTVDLEWMAGAFSFGTDGSRWSDLKVDDNRKLCMNGRGIFNFSVTRVVDCVRTTLARNEITFDSVDRFVLHQGSRFIIDTLGGRLGAPERTPFTAAEIGNTVSSTIPLILAGDTCANDRRVLVCGFGVGLSWAATILFRA